MSIEDFKNEFSLLLRRYASNESPGNALGHQQLLDTIHETLVTILDVKLQFLQESALKTPANNEIVVSTPDAPDVLRMDYNQSTRFEPYKSSSSAYNEDGFRFSDFNGLHTHLEEKVFDNDTPLDNMNNNNKETKNANLEQKNLQMKQEPGSFHQKYANFMQGKIEANHNAALIHIVEEARQDSLKVVSSLQRISEILKPEPHVVRRLSTILTNNPSSKKSQLGNQSFSNNNTSLRSTILRAKAASRRSLAAASDDVVTTPTTSRPSLVMPQPSKLPAPPSTKTKKHQQQSASKLTQYSFSNPNLSADKTKSPPKPARSAKYKHVQSTIPKAITKKKT